MGCRSYRRLLLYREGELTQEEKDLLVRHIATCASCAREAAEASWMHERLAAVRSIDVEARDPDELMTRIVRAIAQGGEISPNSPATTLLDRIFELVASPVYRYATAVALLVAVGLGLWQGGTIAADVRQLELRQSRVRQERPVLPTVGYAIEMDQSMAQLSPELVRAHGVRIEHGAVLVSGNAAEAARAIASTPRTLFTREGLPHNELHTILAAFNRPGVRVRPVLMFKNEKGV